jgi:hypothetical protein
MGTRKTGTEVKKTGMGKKASVGVRVPKPRTEKATKPEDAAFRKNKEKNLGKEAHSVMDEQVSKIVEHLLGQTIKGKVKSAHMLVKLAKKEANAKEALKRGPLRSQVLAWAAEPQWQDNVDGEKAELGTESQEAG